MTRPFSPLFILEVIPQVLPYLWVTFYITLGTVVGGTVLGGIIAKAKMSEKVLFRGLAEGYIYIIRSTPPIVLLFIVFYGLPKLLLSLANINSNGYHRAFFVLISFIILFSATMAEIIRSSYLSIDKGQYEAAVSIGLGRVQALRRIIFPQAAVVAIPGFSNSLIGIIKEGALAYSIGLIDVMGKGTLIIGNNYGAYAIETYIALATIYWVVTVFIERIFGTFVKKNAKGRKEYKAD